MVRDTLVPSEEATMAEAMEEASAMGRIAKAKKTDRLTAETREAAEHHSLLLTLQAAQPAQEEVLPDFAPTLVTKLPGNSQDVDVRPLGLVVRPVCRAQVGACQALTSLV